MKLSEEFILEHITVDNQDLIESSDWWDGLTWQEIRAELREMVDNWGDYRYDYLEGLEEAADAYGYRGLSRSDFVA
jgi:hypothetical protein